MGLFDNLSNPIWSKVSKLPMEKQVSFSIVVNSYGFMRWKFREDITELINKAGQKGIGDASGRKIHASQLSEDQMERLINSFSLGVLSSQRPIGDDSSNKLKYFPPDMLVNMLIILFQMDEKNHTRINRSINHDDNPYSKNSDEARTQVIASWIKVLKINDPEFPRAILLSGFLSVWDNTVLALISGMLTADARTSNAEIINRAKIECRNMPSHIRPFFLDLADRMSSPKFHFVEKQKQEKEPALYPDLFKAIVRDQGRDKIDASKVQGRGVIELVALAAYVSSEEMLMPDEKEQFSRWANLPNSYWGDEHKRAFAIAELHFLKDAKARGIALPPKMDNIGEHIPDDQLPPLEKPLSPGIEAFFIEKYTRKTGRQ